MADCSQVMKTQIAIPNVLSVIGLFMRWQSEFMWCQDGHPCRKNKSVLALNRVCWWGCRTRCPTIATVGLPVCLTMWHDSCLSCAQTCSTYPWLWTYIVMQLMWWAKSMYYLGYSYLLTVALCIPSAEVRFRVFKKCPAVRQFRSSFHSMLSQTKWVHNLLHLSSKPFQPTLCSLSSLRISSSNRCSSRAVQRARA